ncbi:TPA: helix-turn-helix domain-containing protein [Salmonella enterica subsp. enterica serovar 28:e,h:z6]|nr:hypothetical protein [Salmonella enterica subsp. salamae serovar Sofia]HER1262644.1 helix-turn-helix domain-containing protein [Salmonella enterica subsp. enterica serovar 28:e,h:z6]
MRNGDLCALAHGRSGATKAPQRRRRSHKRGLSFRSLSLQAGYSKDSLKSVLRTPCKAYQQIVADALGVEPETVWPSRYQTDKLYAEGILIMFVVAKELRQ